MKRPDFSKVPTKAAKKALSDICQYAEDLAPTAGTGIFVGKGTRGGRPISLASGAGGGVAGTFPFQVVQRENEDGDTEYGVVYESSLYKSLRPNDKKSIDGLLNANRTSGWFSLSPGGYIWLGILFDTDGTITDALIDNSDENDFDLTKNAWSGENGYCEDDGDEDNPTHQASRKLIAYVVSGTSGPILTQVMFRDDVLRDCAIDGRAARYPFDHEGGYPFS